MVVDRGKGKGDGKGKGGGKGGTAAERRGKGTNAIPHLDWRMTDADMLISCVSMSISLRDHFSKTALTR